MIMPTSRKKDYNRKKVKGRRQGHFLISFVLLITDNQKHLLGEK